MNIEIARYPVDRSAWRPLADAPHLDDFLALVEPERPGGPSIVLARIDLRVASTGWIDSQRRTSINPIAWRPIPAHRVAIAGSWKRRDRTDRHHRRAQLIATLIVVIGGAAVDVGLHVLEDPTGGIVDLAIGEDHPPVPTDSPPPVKP